MKIGQYITIPSFMSCPPKLRHRFRGGISCAGYSTPYYNGIFPFSQVSFTGKLEKIQELFNYFLANIGIIMNSSCNPRQFEG